MSEPKWTPGPWRFRKGSPNNLIEGNAGADPAHEGDDGYRIIATYQASTKSMLAREQETNREANGALIAAAPELYAALDSLLPYFVGEHHPDHPGCRQAHAALAKARGETP